MLTNFATNAQPLKILHVVYDCVPGNYTGGIAKVAFELSRAQVRLGNYVEIYTIDYESPPKLTGDFTKTVVRDGVRIHYFCRAWEGARFSPALKKQMEVALPQFDAVHSHNTFLTLNREVASLCHRLGKPAFYHPHGALDQRLVKGWGLKALKKRAYIACYEGVQLKRAAAIFALSESESMQVEGWGIATPIHILLNGIDVLEPPSVEVLSDFRLHWKIPEDSPVLLFIGRISEKKGVHCVIEAMPEILRKYPKAVFMICGPRDNEPAYTARLDATVETLGLKDSIRWTGFLNDSQKVSALASAGLFVHPSLSEGMAMSILEAMGFGLPCVITPGCYMPAAMQEGAALESRHEAGAVAQTILQALDDPEGTAEVGRRASAYIKRHHAWAGIARKTVELYRAAVYSSPLNS